MLKIKKNMLVDGLNKINLKKTFYRPKTVLNKDKDSKNFFSDEMYLQDYMEKIFLLK